MNDPAGPLIHRDESDGAHPLQPGGAMSQESSALLERWASRYRTLLSEAPPPHVPKQSRVLFMAFCWATAHSLTIGVVACLENLPTTANASFLFAAGLLLIAAVQRAGAPTPWLVNLALGASLLVSMVCALNERPMSGVWPSMLIIPPAALSFFGPRGLLRWGLVVLVLLLSMPVFAALGVVTPSVVRHPELLTTIRVVSTLLAGVGFASADHLRIAESLKQAQASVDAKSTFLANISHEIRTPLNGVMGMTEVMLMDEDRPKRREQLEVIQRSGRHLLKLINELLDLTRAERGELALEQNAFSLETVLSEVVSLYRPQAQLKGLELKLSVCPNVPNAVRGDDFRLRQMLGNLINNAVKFTDRGGVVVRLYRLSVERWRFEVEDTGIGIGPAAMKRLFTPFKQADESISRRFGGTGLGLALVRVLAQRMGGEARARSVEGQGSVFSIDVPLPVATVVEPPLVIPPTPAATKLEVPVLVVDDNPVNLRIAAALLTRAGCIVTKATNGEEAVTLACANHFAAIFMDCQMPGVDGWEATRRLRANGSTASVPIIALTASAMADDVAACREAGMNEVLSKPVSYDALKASLGRHT